MRGPLARRGEQLRRLAGEPELARDEPGADVLAGPAGDRQLEVVDRGGAVEGHAPEDPALDPVDQVGGAPRLDDVAPERGDDQLLVAAGPDDRVAEPPQALAGELAGEAVEPVFQRGPGDGGAAQVGQEDLARPLLERLVTQFTQV